MKRKRNTEKICSVTPSGEIMRNKFAKRITISAWERAVLWANKNNNTITTAIA